MKNVLVNFLWAYLSFFLMSSVSARNVIHDEQSSRTRQKSDYVVTIFPWTEGFESNGINLPEGWTQEYVTGNMSWTVASGGAHGGDYKVMIPFGSGPKTKLVTPLIDLSKVTDPVLKFWHVQPAFGNSKDILRIYYKTSAEGTWTLLQEYVTDVPNWTERIISLPNISSDYYIAFEAELLFANGIQLDDVAIEPASEAPVISGISPLVLGAIYNNLPWVHSTEYGIQNQGSVPLTISSVISSSPEIVIKGLPLTIDPLETKTLTIELDGSKLPLGDYSGNFVLASNDPRKPEFSVDATGTVEPAVISNYIRETFNGIDPKGWGTVACVKMPDGGIDNTPCIRGLLHSNQPQAGMQTCYVAMGSKPTVSFSYKAINYEGGNPTAAGGLEYAVYISKDNGETWEDLLSVPAGGHVPSADFTRVEVDASTYANKLCLVQIVFEPVGSANFWLYMDDIIVGTEPMNELAAVSITGNPIPVPGVSQSYKVSVANLGVTSQAAYVVKLMKDGGTEIASLPGVNIGSRETKDYIFEWTPNEAGIVYLYGEVAFSDDEYLANNQTDKLKVYVQSPSIAPVAVGIGSERYKYPYCFYYRESLSQTLYYANELGTNGGEIRSLVYKADIAHTGSNLQDVGVQIWIGETDRENLKDGWIDPSTLTEVFDGKISFPFGQYDVAVPLDIPYKYKGGTLVIYSYRKDSDGGDWYDSFFGTAIPNSYRSISFSSFGGGVNPQTPPAFSDGTHGIPNTTFLIDMEGMGALSGVVSDGVSPLEGVTVRVVGSQLSVLTGVSGEYKFSHLLQGSCAVEVTKYGYITQKCEVTIIDGKAVVSDVILKPLPKFTISGKVTGIGGLKGIQGAQITLTGYNDYTSTTDDAGNYSIPDVFGGFTYDVQVRLKGYVNHSSTIEVIDGDVSKDISLEEKNYPVVNLFAELKEDHAVITWDAPIGYETKKYILDDGVFETGWRNSNVTLTAWFGTKFVVAESGELTSIDLYGLEPQQGRVSERTLTVEIFDENRQLLGASKPFLLPGYDWVNVPLDNIPYSGTFYAMVKWTANEEGETNYLGFDQDGPNANEGTDWYCDSNIGWSSIYAMSEGLRGTFMIRVNADVDTGGMTKSSKYSNIRQGRVPDIASDTTGKVKEIDFIRLIQPVDANAKYVGKESVRKVIPTPTEYTIYRLVEKAPETSWTQLGKIIGTTYTDTGWPALPEGLYQYAVKAVYTGDHASEARLTNLMPKGLEVKATVNVTTNSGAPADGAIVTFTNQDGNLDHVYGMTINAGTVLFPKIWKGTYDMSVELEGFELYSTQNITIEADFLYNVQLKEAIVTPYGLKIEETEDAATRLFSWNNKPLEEKKIAYWAEPNYSNISSLIQKFDEGYGVIYDLTGYPDAVLSGFDFHHAPWGTSGIWDYRVYVVNIDTRQLVYASDILQTTGENKWEEGISLNNISTLGGKNIGVFVEPLSGSNEDAYPVFSSDNRSINSHSYKLNFLTLEPTLIVGLQSNFGELLMNLWILTAGGERIKVSDNAKSSTDYTVYLNDKVQSTTKDTWYEFTNLKKGTYTAGVKAVYSTGETTVETISFTVLDGVGIDDVGLSDIKVYSQANTIHIVDDSQTRFPSVQVIDVMGRVLYETGAVGSCSFTVDIPAGYYVVRLITEEGATFTTKLHLTEAD